MSTHVPSGIPSLRRQHLLAEFSGLKQACPEGVFVSLTPGEPALWSGVMFIRKGPYENAILRFQLSFPDTYPQLPPLVTFSTDMFHPLIAPLTTYMYTTDIQDSGTVSATDEERLPPGGFSLRHGFPAWFGRGARRSASGGQQQPPATPAKGGDQSVITTPESKATNEATTPGVSLSGTSGRSSISTYEILRYIRSTFDDELVLDSLPLEAAGNPGAWHAWKARQRHAKKTSSLATVEEGQNVDGKAGAAVASGREQSTTSTSSNTTKTPASPISAAPGPTTPTVPARNPGEWNWEGVWEDRVKKGITASLSEPVLYGGAGPGDDLIHFLPMEENDVGVVKDNLLRTLGSPV